jgi:hypothetical protein
MSAKKIFTVMIMDDDTGTGRSLVNTASSDPSSVLVRAFPGNWLKQSTRRSHD